MATIYTCLHHLLVALLFLVPIHVAAQSRSSPFGGSLPGYVVDAAAEEEYDYIVVGGGAAGCPLAATLAVPGGGCVLLLERDGTPSELPTLTIAGGFVRTLALADPEPESAFSSEDGVAKVRTRLLGGDTAINAGSLEDTYWNFFALLKSDENVCPARNVYLV